MNKARPQSVARRRLKIIAWLVTFSVLAGLGAMAWRQQHLGVVSDYTEPGWMPEHKSDCWKCIVIHHSASEIGGAVRINQWHLGRGWDGLGYHFVIGNGTDTRMGAVEPGFRWRQQLQGAHCKTDDQFYNQHGIGICLVGNFENHPPDEKQLQSLARLVRFLCVEFKIPVSAIYTHGGVTGETKCPGRYFDLSSLKRRIRRQTP